MIDLTKPIQTRDGRAAQVLREFNVNMPDSLYRFSALHTRLDGSEYSRDHCRDGALYYGTSSNIDDIINVPEKHTREFWVIHYKNGAMKIMAEDPHNNFYVFYKNNPEILSVRHYVDTFTQGEYL